jgi:hypothetical protein
MAVRETVIAENVAVVPELVDEGGGGGGHDGVSFRSVMRSQRFR